MGSGEEAVSHLDNRPADLVNLDMVMEPGIDSPESFRWIIERHKHRKATITSGFSENDRIHQTRHGRLAAQAAQHV